MTPRLGSCTNTNELEKWRDVIFDVNYKETGQVKRCELPTKDISRCVVLRVVIENSNMEVVVTFNLW